MNYGLFLVRNDLRLTATNDGVERFTLNVAQGGVTVKEITAWLTAHTHHRIA